MHTSASSDISRRSLLSLIFTLTVITYLDRLCISAAMPAIAREFNLSADQKGWIFSAFTIAYAAFEIPSGWLGDRYGSRLALTRIVLWWSAFTILTGAAVGFRSLFILRFLFGAGEAGAFPNIARAVSQWMPESQQGRGMSVSFVGLAVGSTMTAPLVLTLLQWQGWRWTFVEFGLIGVVWAILWRRFYRDRSDNRPSGEPHHVPWSALFTSSNMAFIGLMYFAFAYGLYFYITWLPTYLLEARGFSVNSTKWLAALPWAVSALAFWIGGWMTDRILQRTGNLKLARCGVGASGYVASAVVIFFVPQVENNLLAAVLLALALGFQTMTISAAWSVCLDVGRKNAGVVTGFMNTVGNIGGAIAPVVAGYAVKNLGSWSLPFYVMAGVFVCGAAMWLLVDPRRSVIEE
jgi:predicted MFS family arabinose efflux permease